MEMWKPIPEYEGIYSISSEGRVKTLEHWIGNRTVPEIIRKPNIMKGYHCIALKMGGHVKVFRIHRLVAESFIGPPPTKDHQVNHIDGDKSNNRVENLEWVLPKENTQHAIQMGLRHPYDDARRKRIGEKSKQYWKNPEYRQKQREQQIKSWSAPEQHRKRSLAIKEGIHRAKEIKGNG